jgi:predicted RNA-binding Zn ribbon-like protein
MALRNLSATENRLHVKFVGGSLCLDFVNTVGGRDQSGTVIRDKIAQYSDLVYWSVLAGSADPGTAHALTRLAARQAAEAVASFERTLRLREALYRIFQCGAERRRVPVRDVEVLRAELSVARAQQALTQRDGGFVWTFPARTDALDRILWPISLSAAELLTSEDLARVRKCAAEDCGWMFIDTSRNHRRQWCDMQDCGNRAKVKRFRLKGRPI